MKGPPGHWHVGVFYGRDLRFDSGLVLHTVAGGWSVLDENGALGRPGAEHGTFESLRDACREALRLLRAKHAEDTVPCWGAGAPNAVLAELGYTRGRLRWHWWPPRFWRDGERLVGVDGLPAGPVGAPRLNDRG